MIDFVWFLCLMTYNLWRVIQCYRTLHSYNLIWAVCHLFPRQRWRTHTYSVSGNPWPGEPHDLRKTTSARKFHPAFGADSKTRIFYKYVVFKHSSSFYTNSSQRIHTLSSVWHSSYSSTRVKSNKKWISLADIHFFNIHRL